MTLQSLRGDTFYLVEVLAFVLKHLKDRLQGRLEAQEIDTHIEELHWAITVPAIWTPEGKQLMREAACLVSAVAIIIVYK